MKPASPKTNPEFWPSKRQFRSIGDLQRSQYGVAIVFEAWGLGFLWGLGFGIWGFLLRRSP
jgi:hypothetical protein